MKSTVDGPRALQKAASASPTARSTTTVGRCLVDTLTCMTWWRPIRLLTDQISRRFELGGKLALRRSRIRIDRDDGPWFRNGVNLAVARARYHVNHKWDGLLEYRYLETVEFNDDRDGLLVGLYRHIGGHAKLGIGYNFTDYSDDLTNLDYDGGGWYIDLIGKW